MQWCFFFPEVSISIHIYIYIIYTNNTVPISIYIHILYGHVSEFSIVICTYTHTIILYNQTHRMRVGSANNNQKMIIIICFRSLCNQIIVITIINSTQSLPPTDTCVTCMYVLSRGNSLSVSVFF